MHREENFEDGVELDLLTMGGYERIEPAGYDKERALFPDEVVAFVQATQPGIWRRLEQLYAGKEAETLVDSLVKELGTKGALDVLRYGFKCAGKTVRLVYFAPNTGMNPEAQARYGQNRLTVIRQVKTLTGSIPDMLLAVNGLPVVCIELKNQISGANWTVEDAKVQFQERRDPKDPLFVFKQRCLVFFGVDTDEAVMATKLDQGQTRFFPFNKGHNKRAGNPPAEGDVRTHYLWQEVLERGSLLDILARFLHGQVKEREVRTEEGLKTVQEESLIFPRYHQLEVVRKLVAHAQANGSGHNYLIQHSAGSGKSNSIAWLAHRLASLHDDADQKVFHSVIVITDRRVLDQQLQETIYQFDHKRGVVEKIDENTQQLAQALGTGVPIIISTLQKFPYISQAISTLKKHDIDVSIDTAGKRYAVIVDEAHSSQGGETAMELRKILNREGIEAAVAAQILDMDDDDEALSTEAIAQMKRDQLRRGRQPNLSYFAFTATPKYKTKAVFDEPGENGEPPFHLYSMRQAIEEHFILDVLQNFISYERYFKLLQDATQDRDVPRRRASQALARFVDLHPTNIAQKVEIIVEHFRESTRHKIGGRAKAMVVTGSREMAVRYKLAFDGYLREKGYTDIRSLVAFSGQVVLDGDDVAGTYTEPQMNGGISEQRLPEAFQSDDYQVLLVAEKYQTGFDQPLLHTMYVDKRLSGIRAVQTLSRLNRKTAGKEDTFVLDFVNKPDEIFKAFKPYYEETEMGEEVDPHKLNELAYALAQWQIFYGDEVTAWAKIWYGKRRRPTQTEHRQLSSILAKPKDRYLDRPEEEQEAFKSQLASFINLYLFLSQVVPYEDDDLEQLYTFSRFLLASLPKGGGAASVVLGDAVQLEYYRLEKISEGIIDLSEGEAILVKGPLDVGTGSPDEKVKLSTVVDRFNERFGTTWGESERLFIEQVWVNANEDAHLQQAYAVNTRENFAQVLAGALDGLLLGLIGENEAVATDLLNEAGYREELVRYLVGRFGSENGELKIEN